MAIAFDATSGANGAGDLSWTHTPVGTPRGVVVFVNQAAGSTVDQVIGVTYGGVAMTEVALSPFTHTAGDEDAVMHAFFLGASIPTGAQTVAVDVDATGTGKRAQAVTVTAADDTSVDDTSTADIASTTTPSVDLTTTVETVVLAAMHTGVQNAANFASGSNYTDLEEFSHGTNASSFIRRTTNPSAGTVTVDWTQNLEEAGILAVAIREGTGAAAPTVKKLAALGVG